MIRRLQTHTFEACLVLTAALTLPAVFTAHATEARFDASGGDLSERLSSLSRTFANEDGEIIVYTTAGTPVVLSTAQTEQDPFTPYTAGQFFDPDPWLAGCPPDIEGDWSDCDFSYGEPLLDTLEALAANPPAPDLDLDPSHFSTDCEESSPNVFFCTLSWTNACYTFQDGGWWLTPC